MRKALSVSADVVFILIGLLGVALIVVRIFGVRFLVVKTGSMSEECPVGSIVAVYDCDAEQVKENDVITYLSDENSETYVTHRVISVNADGKCFVTQGDANDTPDAGTVPFSSLLGKVVFCIPLLGYPMLWFGNAGKWVLTAAIVAIAAIVLVIKICRKKLRMKKESRGEQGAE